jgi:hypothetical protein
VAEGALYRLDAGALADKQARGRVPKVMGAQRRRQARPPGGRLELEANPDHVQEDLLLARRAGMIPESWSLTPAPQPITDTYYLDADDFAHELADAAARFQLDPQRDQDARVEVWCEAEDLAPRLDRIARPYGVPVYSGGGYGGLKGRRQLAARAVAREVPTVVLVVTDLNTHGEAIYRSAAEDAVAWTVAAGGEDGWLTFHRIAVTETQAREWACWMTTARLRPTRCRSWSWTRS